MPLVVEVRSIVVPSIRLLGLSRIYATLFPSNKSSSRVLEKAGYALEGTLKNYHVKDGKLIDAIMYARVK